MQKAVKRQENYNCTMISLFQTFVTVADMSKKDRKQLKKKYKLYHWSVCNFFGGSLLCSSSPVHFFCSAVQQLNPLTKILHPIIKILDPPLMGFDVVFFFFRNLIVIAVFYTLPVLQLVITYQNVSTLSLGSLLIG